MKIWELFDGLDRAFGTYLVTERDGEKLAGQARTLQQPVNQDIWDLHLTGERSLGVIPIRDDSTCVFAAIDIDTYPLDHGGLEADIEAMGLPLVVCRSKSGGAHLYLFIKPPGALAANIRPKLAEWAAELGYSGVEIFPKQDELRNKEDVGNWINLPYFGGNDDKLRYAIVDGKRVTIQGFIKHALSKAITHNQLEEFQVAGPDIELLEGCPPCLATLARAGFPSGNRNIALFNLGVFCRKKYDDWQDKLDQMNEEFMSPPLSPGESAQIKRNLEKKSYFYKCNDAPINAVCQKQLCTLQKYGIGEDSIDLDFKLEGGTRILTEDVYYIVTINGRRVHLNGASLVAQQTFRISVANQTGFIVPAMKPRQFNAMMQAMTTTAQEVEAPKHSGRRGVVVQEVLQIASSSSTADSWEQCMSGLPLPDDQGGVFLHPHQLVKTLKRRLRMNGLQPQELYEALIGEGIEVKEKSMGNRSFWYLPDLALYKDLPTEETL
jgi:hypothetical protein